MRPDLVRSDLVVLRTQLGEAFNLDELRTLCDDLGIEYENVPGETRVAKARELLKYCYRFGSLGALLQRCRQLRPHLDWETPAHDRHVNVLPEEWAEPLQQWFVLAREFNRNRHRRFSDARSRQGDDLAFAMREAAPLVFGQFHVRRWLHSPSSGKRLAAIKYLDWLQDVEFFAELLLKLATERPFMQLHVLIALDGMADQLDGPRLWLLQLCLNRLYHVERDGARALWKRRLLRRVRPD